MNFDLIETTVNTFLTEYKDYLLDEHYVTLEEFKRYASNFKNTTYGLSRFGYHYSNCPWFSDTCIGGPDTCGCWSIERFNLRISKLMIFYKRLTNKNI